MSTLTTSVLDAADVKTATAAIDAAAPGMRRRLSASLRDALRGRPSAARRYVAAYRALSERLLAAMHEARPDLFLREEDDAYVVAQPDGRQSSAAVELLCSFAAAAPFSVWAQPRSLGTGVALDLLAHARALLPGVEPLSLPPGAAPPPVDDPEAALRFTRLVAQELSAGQSDLERVASVFGLNVTELASLFGVSRQAAGMWLSDGPPEARRAKAATIAALADILAHRLKRARIPGIVRRAAEAYGGATVLELIAADRHEWLLEDVRRSFDYAATV